MGERIVALPAPQRTARCAGMRVRDGHDVAVRIGEGERAVPGGPARPRRATFDARVDEPLAKGIHVVGRQIEADLAWLAWLEEHIYIPDLEDRDDAGIREREAQADDVPVE